MRERKKRERREAIAARALRLFAENGFERVSMREIAQVADVSEPTVFNYFPTKENLVFNEDRERELALLQAVRDRPPASSVVAAFRDRLSSSWTGTAAKQTWIGSESCRGARGLQRHRRELYARQALSLAAVLKTQAGGRLGDVTAFSAARALMGVMAAAGETLGQRLLSGASPKSVTRDVRADVVRAFDLLETGLGSSTTDSTWGGSFMTQRLSRRTALRMLAAGSASVALAACAPVGPSTGTPAAQSSAPTPASNAAPTAAQNTTTGSSQPNRGGTLRMGILGDPVSLDPYITGIFGETLTPMFEQLIQYDEKLNPLPMLAESWEMNKDQTQITIHLRHGVAFHTGRELTSDDVKWNIHRGQQPKFTAFQSMTRQLTGLETPDKYTLVASADGPWLQVWDMLALMPMIDPVSAQSADPATTPVGTGPIQIRRVATGRPYVVHQASAVLAHWIPVRRHLHAAAFQGSAGDDRCPGERGDRGC